MLFKIKVLKLFCHTEWIQTQLSSSEEEGEQQWGRRRAAVRKKESSSEEEGSHVVVRGKDLRLEGPFQIQLWKPVNQIW